MGSNLEQHENALSDLSREAIVKRFAAEFAYGEIHAGRSLRNFYKK